MAKYFPELRAAMARNGHSQENLATLLDMSTSQIARRLTGHTEWTISEVDKVCQLYQQPYEKLFMKEVSAFAPNR